jgi:hypothetical protein
LKKSLNSADEEWEQWQRPIEAMCQKIYNCGPTNSCPTSLSNKKKIKQFFGRTPVERLENQSIDNKQNSD